MREENLRLGRENLRLQRAVDELGILNEIAMAINSTLALEKILDLVTQRCVHHLQAEQGAVLLLEERKTARPFRPSAGSATPGTSGCPSAWTTS